MLNKKLTLDIIRQIKIPTALCSTDLQGCYDRIAHAIASLALQRHSISKSEVTCVFATLQNLEHTMQCAYGHSSASYGSNIWALPLQGTY